MQKSKAIITSEMKRTTWQTYADSYKQYIANCTADAYAPNPSPAKNPYRIHALQFMLYFRGNGDILIQNKQEPQQKVLSSNFNFQINCGSTRDPQSISLGDNVSSKKDRDRLVESSLFTKRYT